MTRKWWGSGPNPYLTVAAALYADESSFEDDNIIGAAVLEGSDAEPYGAWAKYLGASIDGANNAYCCYVLKPIAWRYPGYWWFRLRTSKLSFYRYSWWISVRLRGPRKGTKVFLSGLKIAASMQEQEVNHER